MNYQDYQSARRGGLIPAHVALSRARRSKQLDELTERLQFAWLLKCGQCDEAAWEQDGFDLRAKVVDDEDGWFSVGIDVYGRFSDRWQAGAVRHWMSDSRSYRWFVPALPEYRHEYYRRACDYGHGWNYVGIRVVASKAGVPLGETALWGIESDSDIDYFTETALDLGEQALVMAHAKLRELCGGSCQ
jgi:hypothetical protein